MLAIGVVVLSLVAATGWYCAWRSRGEVTRAIERAGIASVRAAEAAKRSADSDMVLGVVVAQRQALEVELAAARLAVPVMAQARPSSDLIESTVARLKENEARSKIEDPER